jgi:hypothetical protein
MLPVRLHGMVLSHSSSYEITLMNITNPDSKLRTVDRVTCTLYQSYYEGDQFKYPEDGSSMDL